MRRNPIAMLGERAARPMAASLFIAFVLMTSVLAGCSSEADNAAAPLRPETVDGELVNSVGMGFVCLKGGRCELGSPEGEEGRETPYHLLGIRADEYEPLRTAEVAPGIYIGTCEVTVGQFRRFRPSHRCQYPVDWGLFDPKHGGVTPLMPINAYAWTIRPSKAEKLSLDDDSRPVVCVSWDDAVAFCQWLTALPEERAAGRAYRLPTEDEWEYACRAGSSEAFFWGDSRDVASQYANVADKALERLGGRASGFTCDDRYGLTAPVASYEPNGFGLHDMIGNVWEICAGDIGPRDERNGFVCGLDGRPQIAIRGGAWSSGPATSRCAARYNLSRNELRFDVGFRVVCVVAQ